ILPARSKRSFFFLTLRNSCKAKCTASFFVFTLATFMTSLTSASSISILVRIEMSSVRIVLCIIHKTIHKEKLFRASGGAEGLHEASAEPELALDNHARMEGLGQNIVVSDQIERAACGADQRPGEILPGLGIAAALGLLHLPGQECPR